VHKVEKKIIISGPIIEYIEFEKPYWKDFEVPNRQNKSRHTKEGWFLIDNREKSLRRAKNEIRRLINANSDIFDKFITLTFQKNETDLDYCNYEFKKFIQRLKYNYGNIEYIVVVEFQKRGAVHYHLLCNLGYVRNSTLRKIWGNGFVKINRIDRVDNLGAYVTKYMQKDINDERLQGRKSYFRSKGLKEPITYTTKKEVESLAVSLLHDLQPVYENTVNSEYTGLTTYKQFNLLKSGIVEPTGTTSVIK
jgi:hypothetical protein